MQEAKNTARALVRIGYDGRVHKHFKGLQASERFANEQYVLQFLAQKGCEFVPRILSSDPNELYLITSNAGQRAEHITKAKCQQMFAKLEQFGVRHDDTEVRNITYNEQQGQFNIIDFEFSTILEPGHPPAPIISSVADRSKWDHASKASK